MVAPLNDLAVLQHHDGVGGADGGEAVGDHEGGAVLHQPIHAPLNVSLGTGVHRGGGLVQHQDGRLGHGGTGDVEQLALTLGQIGTVALETGLIAVLQAHDEAVGRGGFGGLHHLLVGGVGATVSDVLHDGAREQVRILQNHGDVAPQLIPLVGTDVHAVDGDGSLVDIVEAVEQVGDGGLARARGADEGDLLTRVGIEADVLQHGLTGQVTEGHVLQHHLAPQIVDGDGIGTVGGLGGLIHNSEHPLGARQGGEDGGHLHGDVVDGEGELAGIVAEQGQAAHVKARVEAEQATHARRGGKGQVGEVVHDGAHNAAEEVGLELLVAHVVVQGLELLHANVLVVEHLDHLGARDGLLDVAVHRAQRGLLGHVVLGGALGNEAAAKEVEGHEEDGDEGEDPVGVHHHDEGAHQRHRARDQAGDGVVDHHVHRVDIVGKAGHELARGMGVKVADGELLQLFEQVVAHLFHRVLGDGHHEASLQVGGHDAHGVDDRHDQKDHGQATHPIRRRLHARGGNVGGQNAEEEAGGGIRRLPQHVDDHAEQVSARQGGQGGAQHADQHDENAEAVGGDVARQASDGGAAVLGLALGTGAGTAAAGAAGAGAHATGLTGFAEGRIALLKFLNASCCHYAFTSPL